MTNPPEGSDQRGERSDPGQPPYPSYGQPPQPPPGSQYGQWGRAPGQPGYGQPGQPWAQQPAYGQPGQPWAHQPGGAPPKKSRAGLIAAVAGLLVVLALGGVPLAFALRPTVLDPRSVERDVAAQFEEREGVAIDLDCDDDMPVESGASYTCIGTTADGEDVTLEITVTDEDQAAYTWTEP